MQAWQVDLPETELPHRSLVSVASASRAGTECSVCPALLMYLFCFAGDKFRLVKCLLGDLFCTYYKKALKNPPWKDSVYLGLTQSVSKRIWPRPLSYFHGS